MRSLRRTLRVAALRVGERVLRPFAAPDPVEQVEERLRGEVVRLGALIDAPEDALVQVGPDAMRDMGYPYVTVDPDGTLHWKVSERGRLLQDRVARDDDELLFWSFRSTTFAMSSTWTAAHPVEGQQFRATLWAHQQELLARLDPRWVDRWRAELVVEVADAAPLLPPRPGTN